MQRRLMVLGLSSLGRAEGRVLASLDAVMVALASLAATDVPAGEPAFPSPLLSRVICSQQTGPFLARVFRV
jgi:hypothetical protein